MIPRSADITKLESEVEALFNLTLRASARFRFLKPMLDNRKLIDRIELEGKGEGFNQLRNWLYWGLVLELSKLCRDNDTRSPSIYAIRERLANDASLVQTLEDKYAKANRQMFEEAELRAEFRKIYKRFEKGADEMLAGRVAGGYRTIRNKLIAHNELRKDGQFHDVKDEKLKYGDEHSLLKTLSELITDLALIVKNTDVQSAWNTPRQWDDEIATTFWDLDSSNQRVTKNQSQRP
jgi:AbiU2